MSAYTKQLVLEGGVTQGTPTTTPAGRTHVVKNIYLFASAASDIWIVVNGLTVADVPVVNRSAGWFGEWSGRLVVPALQSLQIYNVTGTTMFYEVAGFDFPQ